MLPKLFTKYCSLRSTNTKNLALTFSAVLGPNGSVLRYKVGPSVIGPTFPLDFEEGELLLANRAKDHPTLVDRISQAEFSVEEFIEKADKIVRQRLIHRGSPEILFNEFSSSFRLLPDGDVTISKNIITRPQEMVYEFCLLAGEIGARFARDNDIPFPYYRQAPPSMFFDWKSSSLLTVVERWKRVSGTAPIIIGTLPAKNEALGLECYSKVSAPLRSYLSLLSQYQILSKFYPHTPPLKDWEVEKSLQEVQIRKKGLKGLLHRSQRFWTLRYFEQEYSSVFPAVVLSIPKAGTKKEARVLLADLGLVTLAYPSNTSFVGERVSIVVETVDSLTNSLKLAIL
eukprot:TRINITY_DN1837_c0_g1_i1.p1 TRINITY_DN1837_c0_g1~~TRINITY_DN1837_c0_g1_i1.p1  ORF type:complete len:342 (+),score=75.06 TRINITY_DN1837_c0_g1_i1:354-1379(+)